MKNLKDFNELTDILGGTLKLAYKLNVRQQTVESWGKSGIPTKYWDDIACTAKHRKVTPLSLFNLNKKITNKK